MSINYANCLTRQKQTRPEALAECMQKVCVCNSWFACVICLLYPQIQHVTGSTYKAQTQTMRYKRMSFLLQTTQYFYINLSLLVHTCQTKTETLCHQPLTLTLISAKGCYSRLYSTKKYTPL